MPGNSNPDQRASSLKLFLPVNCISHSLTLSICILERSVRSSYSLRKASSDIENVARAREASRPANKPYGPPKRINNHITFAISTYILDIILKVNSIRPPDKSAYWKIIFFISHPKHMLWVLKRTVSMRQFF